jgi:hypothetical protein
LVFRTDIEKTETNRTYSKQNFPKTLSIRVSSKQVIFVGSNRNKPQFNLFWLFFSVFVSPQKIFSVCFGVSDRYRSTETKLMVQGIKKVYIFIKICCSFSWSFVCFGCFVTPNLPVSIVKRNNRNKRLVSDSADTLIELKLKKPKPQPLLIYWGN